MEDKAAGSAPSTSKKTKKEVPLGNYLLTRRIGQGNFGVVFRGHHKDTLTLYAIKVGLLDFYFAS